MKKLLLSLTVSAAIIGASPFVLTQNALAESTSAETHDDHAHDDHASDEGRIDHYEGVKIESTEQAMAELNEDIAEIAKILEQEDDLEFLQLERIHEISYSLENSVDYLRKDGNIDQGTVDAADEAVQAVHFSSENQEEAKIREWFEKLQAAFADIEAGDTDEEKTTDTAQVKKDVYEIVIKDHKFSPEEITVPAGEKIKLLIDNQDATPEEFESHDMNREKIIAGNTKATIFVGPLKPGRHHFFGEFNMETANGYIIAE